MQNCLQHSSFCASQRACVENVVSPNLGEWTGFERGEPTWVLRRLRRADSCLLPDAAQPVIRTGSGHAPSHDDELAQTGACGGDVCLQK